MNNLSKYIIIEIIKFIPDFGLLGTCVNINKESLRNSKYNDKMDLLKEALKFTKINILSIRYCNFLLNKAKRHKELIDYKNQSIMMSKRVDENIDIRCYSCVKKTGNRCRNKKKYGSLFCGVHKKSVKCYWA